MDGASPVGPEFYPPAPVQGLGPEPEPDLPFVREGLRV